ncbi:unnamed protein product [Amoebophrya sp. A120]|nr:unnamed protein product [Amoebophrya sp. A120]|eukprot:GSA120T00008900001.1
MAGAGSETELKKTASEDFTPDIEQALRTGTMDSSVEVLPAAKRRKLVTTTEDCSSFSGENGRKKPSCSKTVGTRPNESAATKSNAISSTGTGTGTAQVAAATRSASKNSTVLQVHQHRPRRKTRRKAGGRNGRVSIRGKEKAYVVSKISKPTAASAACRDAKSTYEGFGCAADQDQETYLTDEKYWEIQLEKEKIGKNFTEYYHLHQKLFAHDGTEWQKFFKFLHQPICVSFRFSSLESKKAEVGKALLEVKKHFLEPSYITATGRTVPKPVKFRFGLEERRRELVHRGKHQPNTAAPRTSKGSTSDAAAAKAITATVPTKQLVAFQMCYDAKTMQKFFPEIQKWLVEKHRNKVLERQEIVSMFPVFLLNVQKSHRVLDLCASPGSKTSQALERILDVSTTTTSATPDSLVSCPTTGQQRHGPQKTNSGFLFANEFDQKRAGTLAKRVQFGAKNVVVTNHRAQIFPEFFGKTSLLKFDRIIADVPCSGDGTMRKYEEKWRSWNPFLGQQLHSLQVQILLRGLKLLASDTTGLLCYSTCSLNPLENEAVVQAVLRKIPKGCVEVVDVHDSAKSGIVAPCRMHRGLEDWTVVAEREKIILPADGGGKPKKANANGTSNGRSSTVDAPTSYTVLSSYQESQKLLGKEDRKKYRETMWPVSTTSKSIAGVDHEGKNNEVEDHRWIKKELRKCARLMPHYSNTGAFFCCLFRKKKEFWDEKKETQADQTAVPEDECDAGSVSSRRKLSPTFVAAEVDEKSSSPIEDARSEITFTGEKIKAGAEATPDHSEDVLAKKVIFIGGQQAGHKNEETKKGKDTFKVNRRLYDILSQPHPFKVVFAGERQ